MKSRMNFRDAMPETPAHFVRAMDETLERIENMKQKKNYARTAVLIALAAALLVGGAFAAGNWNLFRPMTDSADPIEPLPGADELIETNLARVENDYVTVEVIEALYDGQTAMAAVRIAAKDPAEYVPFHAFLQEAPEEEYITGRTAVPCGEGRQTLITGDAEYEIVNEPGAVQLFVNGAEVEIPLSDAEAVDRNLPVYLADGALYYANQWDYRVTGRRDGRKLLGYSIAMTCAEPSDEGTWAMAEEQPDGSVILWLEQNMPAAGEDRITVLLSGSVTADGETIPLSEAEFTLTSESDVRTTAYRPAGELERVRIRSVEYAMTPVKGYVTVVYEYLPLESESMGIAFRLMDGEGNPVPTGSGWRKEEEGEDGWLVVTERAEVQSFAEPPEELAVSFKVIGQEEVLGSISLAITENP